VSLSTAQSRVRQAQALIDQRRYDDVPQVLDAAMEFLVGIPEAEAAPVLTDIAALRQAAVQAAAAEQAAIKVRGASRELRYAAEELDRGYSPSSVEPRLDNAEKYLDGLNDAERAPLQAELTALRARLDGKAPASTPAAAGDQADGAAAPAPAVDEERLVSRAASAIRHARMMLQSGRVDAVEEKLQEAAELVADLSETTKAPLLREVDSVRAEAAGAIAAERIRRIESELDTQLSAAEDVQTWRSEGSAGALAYVAKRLADDDVRSTLPTEAIERYQARLAAAKLNFATVLKADTLDRAYPLLRDLEQRLESDPFTGLGNDEVYRISRDLMYLRDRIVDRIKSLPADDPDVVSINARVAATDEQLDNASAAWGKAARQAEVVRNWAIAEHEFAGWEQEAADPDAGLLDVPDLPKTRTAIMRIRVLLADPETVRIRAENQDDPVIEGVYSGAEKLLDAAVAKLAGTYDQVLDEAGKVPAPMGGSSDLELPGHFAAAVEITFEATAAAAPLLARIRELDERWQAEVAAIRKARQELYDKLTVEADAAWPAILEATGATSDFDPGDPSAVGRTVLLDGVYNRSGWEFSDYEFAMRLKGVPIGAQYEPHVRTALEYAWYELKLDVSDRITWDVVGVVEGPGQIGERTVTTVKGTNNEEIGKIEEWRPVDCVRLRITALHAGPVAVGPGAERPANPDTP
jgi:hypothetical protein